MCKVDETSYLEVYWRGKQRRKRLRVLYDVKEWEFESYVGCVVRLMCTCILFTHGKMNNEGISLYIGERNLYFFMEIRRRRFEKMCRLMCYWEIHSRSIARLFRLQFR